MNNLKKYKIDGIELSLITENNIDITNENKTLIKDIYDKYKDKEDNCLYLYYLETSLIPKKKYIMNKKEKFNFKEKYTLEERKKMYKDLKNKNKNKILIIFENEYENENEEIEKKNEILFYDPNKVINSLRMKIWIRNGKPFLKTILKDENKEEIDSNTKIIDLYNDNKDKEDEFLYLFYTMNKANFNIMENELKNMLEGYKIFLLFNCIPFVFRPGPSYANSNTQKKVFLEYFSKTFNNINTDKKYKYYIEYPDKKLNNNEKLLDFYIKNRNKNDDFLYLIIEKK